MPGATPISPPLPLADERLLLHTATDVMVRGSNDGVLEWLSPSVEQVLGWSPDQLVGQRFLDFVHPDHHSVVREGQRALVRGQQRNFEVRLRHCDGTYRWMSINLRPLVDEAGRVVGRAAAWRDIQAEVAARDVALQALARQRAALDAMPDPYAVLVARYDHEGEIVDVAAVEANEAACRFMQCHEADLVGVGFTTFMPHEVADRYISSFRRVLATGEPLLVDRAAVPNGPGGAVRYYDARAARIDRDHLGFTWRDVTSQVLHERTRADLMLQESLADERDRVARDLHDGAIQHVYATGMVLRSVLDHLPAEVRGDLERVIDAHDDIIRELRTTILGLVRPDVENQAASVLLERLMAEAERSLGFVPHLVVAGGGEALDRLGNPTLVQHLLYSLREMLSNVARHAAAGWVEVALTCRGDVLEVRVSDDGVGAHPGSGGGHGLGNLNRRAELLGGSFRLEPRLPTGTVAYWTAHLPSIS